MAHLWIFVAVLCSSGVFCQVSALCRPNETFLTCGGCQRTCEDPSPACAAICRTGCYCPDDMVRGKDGVCVPLSDCPSVSVQPYHEDEEPRSSDACPESEEYRLCEPCGNKTCDNPTPICPAQCARGCFCKDDMVRNEDGHCVKPEKCSAISNYVKRNSGTECGANQEFKECEKCDRICSYPKPVCADKCLRGCFCKEGYYRSPNGACVPLRECPKDYCTDKNAEYTCRYPCEDTCVKRHCNVRAGRCSVGCFCKSGFVKDESTGFCVRPEQCKRNIKA